MESLLHLTQFFDSFLEILPHLILVCQLLVVAFTGFWPFEFNKDLKINRFPPNKKFIYLKYVIIIALVASVSFFQGFFFLCVWSGGGDCLVFLEI